MCAKQYWLCTETSERISHPAVISLPLVLFVVDVWDPVKVLMWSQIQIQIFSVALCAVCCSRNLYICIGSGHEIKSWCRWACAFVCFYLVTSYQLLSFYFSFAVLCLNSSLDMATAWHLSHTNDSEVMETAIEGVEMGWGENRKKTVHISVKLCYEMMKLEVS